MKSETPTLIEEQLKGFKEAGLPVNQGTVVAHKPGVKGANRAILEKWLPIWIRNAFKNHAIASGAAGLSYLRASAKGLPAIVVGIGPSLDQTAERVTAYQRNAIIISTDAALRPLLARNVTPHLVVSIDARPEQHVLFDDVASTEDIVLVAPSTTDAKTLQSWKDKGGQIVLFNMEHHGIEFMDLVLPHVFVQLGSMCVHGTVGNTATLLAYQMGCTKILGVGMDLCYGQEKEGEAFKYRCRDFSRVEEGGAWHWQPKECKVLYDNDLRLRDAYPVELKGKKFIVDPELELYRKALFELVGSMVTVPFTNCAPGGILGSVGFHTQEIDQALLENCSRRIEVGESVVLHLPEILKRRD
jgi:hypothetical protein